MITIRQSTETGMETVQRRTKKCWIDVTNPTPDEAKNLTRDLSIPSEFVTYSLNPGKIPLVEKANGALLVLVRVSHFQSASASTPCTLCSPSVRLPDVVSFNYRKPNNFGVAVMCQRLGDLSQI
jgi:Mg2+ and Co2+ transporter CorA